jgi:ClpP class serine protease
VKQFYAMERSYLENLRDNRRELFAVARSLKTADAIRVARDELVASAQINLTPKSAEDAAKTYTIDENGAAHIPITGELTPAAKTDACGAYTAEALTEYGFIIAATQAADADPKVVKIIYDVDSPGGYVDGVDQAAQVISSASKPTEAHVWGGQCSGAYWLTASCDRIVSMNPTTEHGSIGVAAEEYNEDEALARDGIRHTVYTSTDAPDKRPDTSTPEGKAKIVKQLNDVHKVFVSRVAEGRGVSIDKVNADFGHGGILLAADALAAGMIDEVRGVSISRRNKTGVAGETASASTGGAKISGGQKMTLDEFKAANPGVLEAHDETIRAAAHAEGVKAEAARRDGISAFLGKTPEGDRAVAEAIASGKSVEAAMPALVAASIPSKSGTNDNAPSINAKTPDTVAGTDGLTEDDHKAMNAFNLTPDQLKKYGNKEAD